MNQKLINKAGKVIESNTGLRSYCTLALLNSEGFPTVSTITASKTNGINWITFCTGLGSDKVNRIKKCNKASVCFNASDYNITLVGTIEILTDSKTKNDMWYSGLTNHFNGPEDPNYCVLRFNTETYNLLIDWEEVQGKL